MLDKAAISPVRRTVSYPGLHKRCWSQTNNQSEETSERIHPSSALQDGGSSHVKMTKDLLRQGDTVAKVDLEDTYFAVPISEPDKKNLRFTGEPWIHNQLPKVSPGATEDTGVPSGLQLTNVSGPRLWLSLKDFWTKHPIWPVLHHPGLFICSFVQLPCQVLCLYRDVPLHAPQPELLVQFVQGWGTILPSCWCKLSLKCCPFSVGHECSSCLWRSIWMQGTLPAVRSNWYGVFAPLSTRDPLFWLPGRQHPTPFEMHLGD